MLMFFLFDTVIQCVNWMLFTDVIFSGGILDFCNILLYYIERWGEDKILEKTSQQM